MRRLWFWLSLLIVAGAVSAGGYYWWRVNHAPPRPTTPGGPPGAPPAAAVPPPASVYVADIVQKNIAQEFTVIGTILPARRSIVSVGSPGRVTDFYVKEGDFVADQAELLRQRVKDLEIERAGAVATFYHRLNEFIELSSGYRTEDIDQAAARLELAKVQENFARRRLERTRKSGAAASPESIEEAEAAFDIAVQSVAQAKAQHEMFVAGPREEAINRAAAAVALAVSDIERIDEDIWKKTLRAPFEGYVSAKFVELGEFVAQGAAGVEVIELRTLEIEVRIPEKHVARVKEGQAVTVAIEALGAVGPNALQGTVLRIIPNVDPQTRTLPVRIGLENQIDELSPAKTPWIKAGMLAHVSFSVGDQTVLLAPKDSLVFATGREPVVYVVGESKIEKDGQTETVLNAFPVVVSIGEARDDLIEVSGQLQPGMKVVTRGNERLFPGQPLRVAGGQ